MDLLSKQELQTLIQKPDGPCVSIYMPTHRAGAEIQQDPIRFKNLLREAEERLVEAGLRRTDVVDQLKAIQELDQTEFWRYQSDGLAIFWSSNLFRYYRLPLNFEELVVVSDRLHIKPLLPLFTNNGRFYVLALSQNSVRLLQGTQNRVSEVELEKVPQSLDEALKYNDSDKQTRHRTNTGPGRVELAGSVHGVGVTVEEHKDEIQQYFNQIDGGLHERFRDEHVPLVLAGVEYLLPIYREANSYAYLMEQGITGNPEEISAEELHQRAWEIVQPYFQQAQEKSIGLYQDLLGTGRVSNDIREIVSAAYYQRVDPLFVAINEQQWGLFNPGDGSVQLHDTQETGDEDLIDLAAVHTFLNGGTVYAVDAGVVPGNTSIAAVFRY